MPKDSDIRKLAQGLIDHIKALTAKQKPDNANCEDSLALIQAILVYFILLFYYYFIIF